MCDEVSDEVCEQKDTSITSQQLPESESIDDNIEIMNEKETNDKNDCQTDSQTNETNDDSVKDSRHQYTKVCINWLRFDPIYHIFQF